MKPALTIAATLAAAALCIAGADFAARRLLLWLVTLLTLLVGAGCTFAYVPDSSRIRICPPPTAYMCDSRYEGSEM